MKASKSRSRSVAATFLSMLLAVVLVATGCAPKVVTVEDTGINMMMYVLRNLPMDAAPPDYTAVLLQWNVAQNTITSSQDPILHMNGKHSDYPLHWSSGASLIALQALDLKTSEPLLTTMTNNLRIVVPPDAAQHAPSTNSSISRWYAVQANAFVTAPCEILPLASQKTLDGRTMTIAQYSAAGATTRAIAVTVPSDLAQMVTVYGSGSLDDGFVVINAISASGGNDAGFDIWLLRMSNGNTTWVKCKNESDFRDSLFAGMDASFAHVGSLLYFTHGHGKIYCIDTAATGPSVTVPETANALLEQMYKKGPTDSPGPLQAALASDNGMLVIEYPDYAYDVEYDAVSPSGEAAGRLIATTRYLTSFDNQWKIGTRLPLDAQRDLLLLPSSDLFESHIY